MTVLNVSGLKDSAKSLGPGADGTYAHIGARGGTEMMMDGLRRYVDPQLLSEFNIICSRVRDLHPTKKNILWLHDTWDDPESEHLADDDSRKRFAKLVFVSNYQQATYNIGRGVPHSDGVVLQNAIDPIPEHKKSRDKIIRLIYHTTPHRGLEILVPVVEHLAKANYPIHLDVYSSFNIYGWGQRDEPYREIFKRIEEHPNMTYHGFQPNDIVRDALQKAHIYAYPNIWPETSAISVIEAMSAGCNIVCPNFAALPETTANFAVMYPFIEDYNDHANRFASVLAEVINGYWDEGNQNKLRFQKIYADNFYGWALRSRQWTSFLNSLREENEEA
jgi:UDP-glucose:(glucosyl)LPS alpha-1,2-glucosyltransferase